MAASKTTRKDQVFDLEGPSSFGEGYGRSQAVAGSVPAIPVFAGLFLGGGFAELLNRMVMPLIE